MKDIKVASSIWMKEIAGSRIAMVLQGVLLKKKIGLMSVSEIKNNIIKRKFFMMNIKGC